MLLQSNELAQAKFKMKNANVDKNSSSQVSQIQKLEFKLREAVFLGNQK